MATSFMNGVLLRYHSGDQMRDKEIGGVWSKYRGKGSAGRVLGRGGGGKEKDN